MTIEEVVRLVSDRGVPAILLVVIVWAGFRILKPMLERAFAAHLDLVTFLKDTLREFGETLREIRDDLRTSRDRSEERFDNIDAQLREIRHGGPAERSRK